MSTPPHNNHGQPHQVHHQVHANQVHGQPNIKTIPKKPFFNPFWIGFGAMIGGYMLWKERRQRQSDWAMEDKPVLEARLARADRNGLSEADKQEIELAIAEETRKIIHDGKS
jgi:hypothetical protein